MTYGKKATIIATFLLLVPDGVCDPVFCYQQQIFVQASKLNMGLFTTLFFPSNSTMTLLLAAWIAELGMTLHKSPFRSGNSVSVSTFTFFVAGLRYLDIIKLNKQGKIIKNRSQGHLKLNTL